MRYDDLYAFYEDRVDARSLPKIGHVSKRSATELDQF